MITKSQAFPHSPISLARTGLMEGYAYNPTGAGDGHGTQLGERGERSKQTESKAIINLLDHSALSASPLNVISDIQTNVTNEYNGISINAK